jgi:hypothetical protein
MPRPTQEYLFANIPWGSGHDAARLQMRRLGFVDTSEPAESRDLSFSGQVGPFDSWLRMEFTYASTQTVVLALRKVLIVPSVPETEYEAAYTQLRSLLVAKYGEPPWDLEDLEDFEDLEDLGDSFARGATWGDQAEGDDQVNVWLPTERGPFLVYSAPSPDGSGGNVL